MGGREHVVPACVCFHVIRSKTGHRPARVAGRCLDQHNLTLFATILTIDECRIGELFCLRHQEPEADELPQDLNDGRVLLPRDSLHLVVQLLSPCVIPSIPRPARAVLQLRCLWRPM